MVHPETVSARTPRTFVREVPEPGDRCSYDYDNTHDVTVIIQRIE